MKQFNAIELILPLGISFYTFQAIGYLIDVYRGKYRAEKSYFNIFLFLSYFPQVIQGQ
jgi:alginate O-acetyltransferase complex protein AlgI